MPSQFLPNLLTLYQTGGIDYAHHITTGTTRFLNCNYNMHLVESSWVEVNLEMGLFLFFINCIKTNNELFFDENKFKIVNTEL